MVERTFPSGVTSWIDLTVASPDHLDAAADFYGSLFGWTLSDVAPPGVPRYLLAQLDGADAAGLAVGARGEAARWNTYVAVADADASVEQVRALGFEVLAEAADAGPAGRSAAVRDPEGAELRLWQAGRRRGVQVANVPGAWNFSDLRTCDVAAAAERYAAAFGWAVADQGWSTSIRVPGYGDHLEATVDPDIRTRQAHAPEGFADVIGSMAATGPDEVPHWHVTFTVADRDDAAATVERLGGTVIDSFENDWVRAAVVRDPLGAVFTASQFAPRGDW